MSNRSSGLDRCVSYFRASALYGLVVILCASSAYAQGFTAPKPISSTTTSTAYPNLVVDAAGNIDVAWIDSTSGINFARSSNGGNLFLPPVVIPGSVGTAFQPQMIVDSTGMIIEIAWAKPNPSSTATAPTFDVFASRSTDGGTTFLTAPNPISTSPAKLVSAPRLAFVGAGVDVVWGNDGTWISQSPDGLTFGAPIPLAIAAQDSGGPRIAVDKSGNIFVAWTDRLAEDPNQNLSDNYCTNPTAGTTDANGNVTVYTNKSGGNYYVNETPATSSAGPSSTNTRNLSNSDWRGPDPAYPNGYFGCSYDTLHMFFDQNDNLHLLWADEAPFEDLLTSGATPQAGGPKFSFPALGVGAEGVGAPSVAVDSNGSIYVAYSAGAKALASTEGIYFNRSDDGGVNFFPEAAVISAPGAISPAYPQIAVDPKGNVNVVWEQADQPIGASGNTFHVFFAHSPDRGDTFPIVKEVSTNPSVLCIPPSGTPPVTPDTTSCGTVQMSLDANSNADLVWVNNPGSAGSTADIDFSANTGANPPDDFSISATPTAQSAYGGQTITFNVTAQATGTFNSAIALGCNDFPEVTATDGGTIRRSDFACAFPPPSSGSITPGNSATANLTIPSNLPPNPFQFAINGTSTETTGITTHRVMVSVTSLGPAGSVQPSSAELAVGASKTFNVTVNPGAFTGAVNFLCSGLPAWIKCAFNPQSMTPSTTNNSLTMTVTVVSAPASMMNAPAFTRRPPAQMSPVVWSATLAALCLLAMTLVTMGRRERLSPACVLRGFAVMALTLVLAAGLVSCGGGTSSSATPSTNTSANTTSASVGSGSGGSGSGGSGSGGSGGTGGGSTPVTAMFTVQAQSGAVITKLGTVSITTP
jgi:hypothetical protein